MDMRTRILAPLLLASGTLLLASCGGPQPASTTDAAVAAEQAAAQAAAEAEIARKEADAAAAAATREAELALQESELKAREAELAAREADLASAAATKAAPTKPVSKPVASKPAVAAKPAPRMVTVPEGTSLKFALASDVSTKSAKVGDTFRAKLAADVVIGDRVAVPAGTIVAGKVARVVSGSDKIGTTPTLTLALESLEYSGGNTVPVSGEFTSTGKSEKGRDTAKIVGGAAAGAILGHQTNDKSSGTIVGGLLGAGAGTLAAKKTGTEVVLAAGTEVAIVLAAPLTIQVN
jgi:hypothetical protein